MLQRWQEDGGVMIIGYEMYRNLAQGRNVKSRKLKEIFNKALVDPGNILRDTEINKLNKKLLMFGLTGNYFIEQLVSSWFLFILQVFSFFFS